MEKVLSPEEIEEVIKRAMIFSSRKLPRDLILFNFPTDHLSIQSVTPINKLILIYGNENFGFKHIHNRHDPWSEEIHWKKEDKNKPELPSKFRRKIIPFTDYPAIADSVYSCGRKNEKRKDAGFENYSGSYTFRDGSVDEYILVLMENTKIIVSLYPKKPIGNIKNPDKFKWNRGTVKIIEEPEFDIVDIQIPYIRNDATIAYTISFVQQTKIKREKCFILIHDKTGKETGCVELGERPLAEFKTKHNESEQFKRISQFVTYQHTELKELEKYILHIERNKAST